jgi:hypothetical protein
MLPLAQVNEPMLNRDTLAVWVKEHDGEAQARRSPRRNRDGYTWYSRQFRPDKPDPTMTVRRVMTQRPQRRVITVTLPSLPRLTPLRIYSVAVTVYAATLTMLEVD